VGAPGRPGRLSAPWDLANVGPWAGILLGSATSLQRTAVRYLRHNVGVNSTKMVNTSSRPSSMAAEHTQVWKSLNTP
jgi:hypothetical protein